MYSRFISDPPPIRPPVPPAVFPFDKPRNCLTWLMLSLAVVSIAAQQPDPANPWPDDEEPAHGWYCVPADKEHSPDKEAHACACLGMVEHPVCPKPIDPPTVQAPNDNPKCKVYCHRDHCMCMKQCNDTLLEQPGIRVFLLAASHLTARRPAALWTAFHTSTIN